MKCPKCKSQNIEFIANTQSKNRSAASWLFWILVGVVTCGLGWIWLIFMCLTNKKTVTKTRAICKDCGFQWDV